METEALGHAFRARFPTARYIQMDVSELSNIERVNKLFHSLELHPTDELAELVGKPVNLMQ